MWLFRLFLAANGAFLAPADCGARQGPLKPGKFVIEFLPPIAPGLQKQEFMTRLEETIETASRDLLIRVKTLAETEK